MARAALIVAVFAAAVLLATAAAKRGPTWDKLDGYTFEQYLADFGKTYADAERSTRKELFELRLQEVRLHNAVPLVTFKKAINHMSDWTEAERQRVLGRVSDNMVASVSQPQRTLTATGAPLPAAVDWRKNFPPVVTAVKDQGQCGSCWAHAATEAIESHFALMTGELYVLSQQQLVSCVDNSVLQCGGTGGCDGATAELAWDYVASAGGITQEWNYGYSSYWGDVAACQFVNNQTGPTPSEVYVSGYTLVERNNDTATAEAVALYGPMAISVQADTWMDYEAGVFTNCSYNISMDHAVLLVGYGTDTTTGMDYWLVRNSWSGDWGEQGYIRLARNKAAEECGWNNDWITAGGGCKGGPNTIWACGMCGILYDVVFPTVSTHPGSGSESKSKAWIAGPVVGGVVVLAIIIAVVMKAKKPSGYNNIQDKQDLLERP